jgi:hypothetical protein
MPNTTIFLDLPAYSVQCRPALRNRAGGRIKELPIPQSGLTKDATHLKESCIHG